MAQSSEEPPFLTEGTEVSAKYRGAFCEANVKSVKKLVKCKVTFNKTNATVTINDDCIKGSLKVGAAVEAKHPDGQFMEGVISKLTDASVYTVVFDDGDERTLRRTSLCLKGERHFNESETLDHLPLTDPENFGTPVVQDSKKRKKRRFSHAVSVDEPESPKESSPQPSKKKCLFNDSVVGKVVLVKVNRSKRKNLGWFPGLGVSPDTGDIIKNKDHCLVRSFKDGKYHVVHIGDTREYKKDAEPVCSAVKGDNKAIKLAVERTGMYLDTGKVPAIWEDSATDCIVYDTSHRSGGENPASSEDDENDKEKSVEETEKKNFVDALYAFMEGKGTPILRAPVLGNQDLDLHKLYGKVKDLGGMEKVSSQQLWREVYSQMDIPVMPPSASHHIKMAYKKYLYAFELEETGTSEVQGKDAHNEKKEEVKAECPESPVGTVNNRKKDADCKGEHRREKQVRRQDSECKGEQRRDRMLKRQNSELKNEHKRERTSKRRDSEVTGDDKEENQGVTSARISKQEDSKAEEKRESDVEVDSVAKSPEEDVRVDVVNSPGASSDASETKLDAKSDTVVDEVSGYIIGDKIQVRYGKGKNQRMYEAKVVLYDPNADEGLVYCVHYAGWNTRYDEWINPERIIGRGTRQTRKRGITLAKGQDLSPKTKLPPRPLTKSSPKPVAKKGSKVTQVANKSAVKTSAAVNGSKGSTRRRSLSPTRSLSPLLGKSSAVKTSSSRRTRSDRNSMDLSNGLLEAKSPPSRLRRQRSNTPELTPDFGRPLEKELSSQSSPGPKLGKDLDTVTEEEGKPKIKTEADSTEEVSSNGCEDVAPSEDNPYNDKGKLPTMPNSELDKQAECISNGHRKKEKQKKPMVNGLIRSPLSSETVQKECSLDNAVEPKPKKVKLENENELPAKEIAELLNHGTPEKAPSELPLTTASPTSEQIVGSSLSTRLKQDSVEERKESSESENSNSEKLVSSSDTSPDSSHVSKEKLEQRSGKENKDEKKDSDLTRKQKKKREKRKHRHHSGNDSTGSDVPGSPMTSHLAMPRPSPARSRISFDADLEEIKAKQDGDERIKLLQEKINEMKKMYSSLKAEVASIDRRRKRQKKKREAAEEEEEEEGKTSTNSATPTNLAAVECR